MGGSCSKFFESSLKKVKKLGTRETKGEIHKRGSSSATSSKIDLKVVRKRSSVAVINPNRFEVEHGVEAKEVKTKAKKNNNYLEDIQEVEGQLTYESHGSSYGKIDKNKKFRRPPTPAAKKVKGKLSFSSIPSWPSSKVCPEEFADDNEDECYEDIDENYYTTETEPSSTKSSRKTDSSFDDEPKIQNVKVEVHPEPKRSLDFIDNYNNNNDNYEANLDVTASILNFSAHQNQKSFADLDGAKSSVSESSISKKSNLSRKVGKINKQSKYAMSRNLDQDYISVNISRKSKIDILRAHFEEPEVSPEEPLEEPSEPEVDDKMSCSSLQMDEISLEEYPPVKNTDLIKFVIDESFKVNQNQIDFATMKFNFDAFVYDDDDQYSIPPPTPKMEIISQQAGDVCNKDKDKNSEWIYSYPNPNPNQRNEYIIGMALEESVKTSVKDSKKNSVQNSVKNSEKNSEKNLAISSAKSSEGNSQEHSEGNSSSSGESEEMYDIMLKSEGRSKKSSKSNFGQDLDDELPGLMGGASVTELEDDSKSGSKSGSKQGGSFIDRIKSSASKSFSSIGSKSGMGQDSMAGSSAPEYPDDIKNMNAAANKTAYAPMAGLKWEAPKSCDSQESCCPIGVWTDLCDFQAQWRIEFDQRYIRRMKEQICEWEQCTGCSYDDPCCCPCDPCCGNFGGAYGGGGSGYGYGGNCNCNCHQLK